MDKDNTHIESEFVDHSWQEMAKLLDQEMPVKKRKRRVFWIFFLGIGLLSIIGMVYYRTDYTIEDTKPTIKSLTIPKEGKVATAKMPLNNNHSSINPKKVSIKKVPAKSSDDIRIISTTVTKIHPTAAKKATAVGAGSLMTNSEVKYSNSIEDKKIFLTTKEEIKTASSVQTVLPIIAPLPVNALPYLSLIHI